MKPCLRRILRWVFRPAIRFVPWALAQQYALENRRLLEKLHTVDPSTIFLYDRVAIEHPERCRLGHHVHIHEAYWNAAGGITIGNYVHFGPWVTILTHSHNYHGESIPYDRTYQYKPVVIEDFVWVGANVLIAPGTHIEEGCVIGAGTTLAGRIPRGSVVGAAKWRVLKMRDMAKFEALKAQGKFL